MNDYLQHAVTLTDAKATAFLAAALTVGAGVLQIEAESDGGVWAQTLAVVSLAGSVVANAFVVFPRLPSARKGVVFWEDIRAHRDVESYLQAGSAFAEPDIEREYAAQNYFVSDVLHRKHRWIRCGIALFLLGVGSGLTSFLVNQ